MKNWDLTAMPYAGTTEDRQTAIQQLARAIDLFGDDSKRRMPPKDSAFQLSPDDFVLLKKWVSEGAPDYTGKRQTP